MNTTYQAGREFALSHKYCTGELMLHLSHNYSVYMGIRRLDYMRGVASVIIGEGC